MDTLGEVQLAKMKIAAVLKEKSIVKPGIGMLKFKASLDFKPGQFCNILFEKDGEKLARPFSMCNKPKDELVEFYVKASPDGTVAKHLLELKEGSEATLVGPHGNFVLQETDKEVYFVCAGSGVAPVMSMARELRGSKRKRTFLQGASYADELGYREALEGMAEDDKNFKYVATISRPKENPGWKGNTGRVETLLKHCTNKEAEVYVCGPPPMVQSVMKELTMQGFPRKNLFVEQYY